MPGKFSTAGPDRIAQDIASALTALRNRFERYVAEGPLLYAGFSLGAIQGIKVIAKEPKTFPVALLIEGAYSEITPTLARAYAAGGGKRVLLGCAQRGCADMFAAAEQALREAGVEVRILDTHTGRHNLDGSMMAALHAMWPWLIEGDSRWAEVNSKE